MNAINRIYLVIGLVMMTVASAVTAVPNAKATTKWLELLELSEAQEDKAGISANANANITTVWPWTATEYDNGRTGTVMSLRRSKRAATASCGNYPVCTSSLCPTNFICDENCQCIAVQN